MRLRLRAAFPVMCTAIMSPSNSRSLRVPGYSSYGTENVRLRKGPSTSSEILKLLGQGDSFTVVGDQAGANGFAVRLADGAPPVMCMLIM